MADRAYGGDQKAVEREPTLTDRVGTLIDGLEQCHMLTSKIEDRVWPEPRPTSPIEGKTPQDSVNPGLIRAMGLTNDLRVRLERILNKL